MERERKKERERERREGEKVPRERKEERKKWVRPLYALLTSRLVIRYQLAALVEDLDAYPTRGDADVISSKLAPLSDERRTEAVLLVCGWTVSSLSVSSFSSSSTGSRPDLSRVCVAVQLLRRLAAAVLLRNPSTPLPLESALLQFLDVHIPNSPSGRTERREKGEKERRGQRKGNAHRDRPTEPKREGDRLTFFL
jgi:hypothetical protein